MTVEQLRAYLREHWLRIKEELPAGGYQPQPVLKVEIPRPGDKGMSGHSDGDRPTDPAGASSSTKPTL